MFFFRTLALHDNLSVVDAVDDWFSCLATCNTMT